VGPNKQLSALVRAAGFVDPEGRIARKRFGRAVAAAELRRGVKREITHTHVSRWLNGAMPREATTRSSILEVLGQGLAREVHADEVGFSD